MHFSTISNLFLSSFGFSSATATPVEFAPACSATLYPTILQQISEARPFRILPNNRNFHVAHEVISGVAYNRRYQIVGFENIPAGSYGCRLNTKFAAGYNVTSSGSPTINVRTFFDSDASKIKSPNHWTWNMFYAETASPAFGSGIFGTTTLVPGATSIINSEGCPVSGGNLAYVFEVANSVPANASVEFKQTNIGGVYLTYTC